MYLHIRQPKACVFRFADRSDRPGHDLSTATCACFRWSCFMTTRDIGHEQWQRHMDSRRNVNNNNPTLHQMETTT